ncbi:FixH family protein [Peribacillus asahii]|uniref:FixH family protein n=1 Tax=Peribacillus asahii TaxID=228899 RepID=UPI003824B407
MRKLPAFSILLVLVLLAGCQETEMPEGKEVNSTVTTPLVASISSVGDLVAGKEIIIEASVKQGKEVIQEADEVLIEIRKSGSDERTMLGAKNIGEGKYQVLHTFPDSGKYFVIAHVTTKGLHVMPEKEFVIEEHKPSETSAHPSSDFSIDFFNNRAKAGQKSDVEAAIILDGKPLTAANVSFEVWKEGSEESHFIKAIEKESGKYQNKVSFQEEGTYKIQVHVEKGELHEHQLQTIEVE